MRRDPFLSRRLSATVGGSLRLVIRAYQLGLAPVLPPSCRFEPSCSHYAAEAIARHGPWRGAGLALRRVLRCHPWGGSGYDPVPDRVRRRTAKAPAR